MKSLRFQASRVANTALPTQGELDLVRRKLEGEMRQAGPVEFLPLDTREQVARAVVKVIDSGDLNPKATPGVPMDRLGKTKAKLLEDERNNIINACVDLIENWKKIGYETMLALDFKTLVEKGLVHPTMVKIKQEPHSVEKLQQERYRLFFAISVIHEIVTRVLYQPVLNKEADQWRDLPAKPGIGFTDEMMEDIFRYVDNLPGDSREDNDGSGYDWSQRQWVIDLVTDATVNTYQIDSTRSKLMKIDVLMSYKTPWMLSDGKLYEVYMENLEGKKEWIVWKSGLYTTARNNSWGRISLAHMAALRKGRLDDSWAVTMGDDCVESDLDRDYTQFGIRITDRFKSRKGQKFNFCSHEIVPSGQGKLIPWTKTFYRLLSKRPSWEFLYQFQFELRNNPELPMIEALLWKIGYYKMLGYSQHCRLKEGDAKPHSFSGVCALPQKLIQLVQDTRGMNSNVPKIKQKKKPKNPSKKAPGVTSTTVSKSASQPYVIKRPKDALGSKKEYGSPYNAANHTLAKFTPSAHQAALMAYIHTVANPRIPDPHPVPVMAAPGCSPSEARMYQVRLYGTANANASGDVFIGVNVDSWLTAIPQEMTSAYNTSRDVAVPAMCGKYLGLGGISAPVFFTKSTWPINKFPAATLYPSSYGGAGTGPTAGPGSFLPDATIGVLEMPTGTNFAPGMVGDTRLSCVSAELRMRPEGAAYEGQGDLAIFNWRRNPTRQQYPTDLSQTNPTMGALLAVPDKILSRERRAGANWPSDKWLTAVAVPNTPTCLGQWFPLVPTDYGAQSINNVTVGYPQIFGCGKGLNPGTPIEFEVTFNYGIYGLRDYQTSGNDRADMVIPANTVEGTIYNGVSSNLTPRVVNSKVDQRGVASVLKAEQQAGRAPTGKGSASAIISGLKQAKDMVEEVTGTSIWETVLEGAEMIASLL